MRPHLLLVVALLAAGVARLPAQQPTFSTRVDSVRLDVLVTDGGRIVTGLRPDDFELRDEGVLQQVDLVTAEQVPLSVVLALDTSHSVDGEPLAQLRLAGHALLDGLRADDRAAVLTFDHDVSLPRRPTSDLPALRQLLDDVRTAGLEGPGKTALLDATYAALVVGDAAAYRPLTIVFSDGVDTGSWLTPARVLDAARHLDVVVYGVTRRRSGDTAFLRALATLTGGDLLEAASDRDMRSTFVRILEEFRNRYLLSYTPRGVSRNGWHRVDVRVKGRRATVRGRAGYMAGS